MTFHSRYFTKSMLLEEGKRQVHVQWRIFTVKSALSDRLLCPGSACALEFSSSNPIIHLKNKAVVAWSTLHCERKWPEADQTKKKEKKTHSNKKSLTYFFTGWGGRGVSRWNFTSMPFILFCNLVISRGLKKKSSHVCLFIPCYRVNWLPTQCHQCANTLWCSRESATWQE